MDARSWHTLFGDDLAQLTDLSDRVEEHHYISIWQKIDQHFGPDSGLAMSQSIDPSAKGLLASWISQSETLGEAIDIFLNNARLMSPSEVWHREIVGDRINFYYVVDASKGYPQMAIERSMATAVNWYRYLCRRNVPVAEAEFGFEKPAHSDQFKSIFGDHIQFDSGSVYRVQIERRYTSLQLPGRNALVKSVMQDMVKDALVALDTPENLTQKTRQMIDEMLEENVTPNIDQVASHMGTSRQTLYRKLKAEQTSFKALLELSRKERAHQLLVNEQHSIYAVGLSLGFRETSSFNKAFGRWYGMSPSQYLKKHRD